MRVVQLLTPVLVLGFLAGPVRGGEVMTLEDPKARASYSLGHKIGSDLKRQGLTLDRPAVVRGLGDGQAGAEPLMSPEEMKAQMSMLKKRILARLYEESKQKRNPYLEVNKRRPGVQETDSGLQYKVIEPGTGRQPGPDDKVLVHYRGRTVEGKEFDSSYRRGHPSEFSLDRVILGWREGLQLMREGGTYELYVPYELAYISGPLAYKTLIFEIKLVSVNPQGAQQAETGDKEN